MEFDQVVKAEFGDDVRDIGQDVTARLGDPYRKKFIEEREVSLLIVFEDSPSLQFGSAALSKREALLELAGLVMLLGAVNRDRVGFVHATPDGNLFRQPVRGRGTHPSRRRDLARPASAGVVNFQLPALGLGQHPLAVALPNCAQPHRPGVARRFFPHGPAP